MNKFIATGDNLTIVYKSTTYTYQLPPNIGQVIKLLREQKYDRAIKIIHKKFLIEEISNGKIKESSKGMTIEGQELPDNVKMFIERLIKDKKPVDGIINLWKRLSRNTGKISEENEKISRESLFDYLVNACVRILDNGCFVAYKGVQDNYRDCHSARYDNSPGKIVSMPRENVTVDRNTTCAAGLHVGSFNYMKDNYNNGRRWLECLVDPKDVVSVPTDYNHQKMRVCRYKVIRDVTNVLSEEAMKGVSSLYEGYVEPVQEDKILKKIQTVKKEVKKAGQLTPKSVKVLDSIQKDVEKKIKKAGQITPKPAVGNPSVIVETFELKRISEGRIAVTKTLLSKIGMHSGDTVGIYVCGKVLELYAPSSHCDFELKVVSDGSVRLSKTLADKIDEKARKFKVYLIKEGKKMYLEIKK